VKAQGRLARQWQLLSAISQTRGGLTMAQLKDVTQQSRSNVYKDLQSLMESGLPLTNERGHFRLLNSKGLPPLSFSALQIAALHLARLQLAPLAGAAFVRELDALLTQLRPADPQKAFRFAGSVKPVAPPQVLKTMERAHRYRKRAVIEYRAATRGGRTTRVNIEPLIFNVADNEPYVFAYCVERKAERTYKLVRITSADLTDVAATYKPSEAPDAAFAHAVKAWSGAPQQIRVKLDANIAWLAREYPLPGQKEMPQPDGSLVIEARVAGLIEARRWLLAWGGAAEALAPAELRDATRAELAQALAKYGAPSPTRTPKPPKRKSTDRRTGSLRDRETRAG
jgi:predicted DNA-binding transcriptional regulator YafY